MCSLASNFVSTPAPTPTSQARVLCPQARRWLDEVGELADPALVQRTSDALAALEVSVGLDPGVETNPIDADFSDSD